MSAKLIGADDLHDRLVALTRQGKSIMGLLGLTAVREQKLLVPRKTANLARTIHLGRVTDREAETVASAVYAKPVEFGSKPHIIRPKNKKTLFFPSQKITSERFGDGAKLNFTLSGRLSTGSVRKFGNAAFVYAREVHHPGTKARPFMVPGAQRALARAAGLAKDLVIRAWNGAA